MLYFNIIFKYILIGRIININIIKLCLHNRLYILSTIFSILVQYTIYFIIYERLELFVLMCDLRSN